MTTQEEGVPLSSVQFKRRKITRQKRVKLEQDASDAAALQAPVANVPDDARSPPNKTPEDDSAPNLKEILRNRKRPRDRQKEVARKAEEPKRELVAVETPRDGHYTRRFVAQTGQVVDRDDKQMTKYVEARLAEQNYRQYGWPVPNHLQSTVGEIAPDLKRTFTTSSAKQRVSDETQSPADIEQSIRTAAGNGRIEEVNIDPIQPRTDEKWRRLENGEFEQITTGKIRLGRDGRPRRPPKRRNSNDVRRDQMVEAVLSEAKLDFFDAQTPSNPRFGDANNDEAILAQFEADYYESIEEARQQQRKPAAAPGAKGAPEAPKGPKLGGSKSIRARMRLAQEQAAKAKR